MVRCLTAPSPPPLSVLRKTYFIFILTRRRKNKYIDVFLSKGLYRTGLFIYLFRLFSYCVNQGFVFQGKKYCFFIAKISGFFSSSIFELLLYYACMPCNVSEGFLNCYYYPYDFLINCICIRECCEQSVKVY